MYIWTISGVELAVCMDDGAWEFNQYEVVWTDFGLIYGAT